MVYFIDSVQDINTSEIKDCAHYMPNEKRILAKAFRHSADMKREIGAYMLMAYSYFCEYGEPFIPELIYGKYGKPYIRGYKSRQFSLSHSGRYAACGFSSSEIGVDIQEEIDDFSTLLNSFLSKEEKRRVSDSKNKKESFTEIWSMKESYFKYTGRGIPESPYRYDLCDIKEKLKIENAAIKTVKIDSAYLSVCSKEDEKIRLVHLSKIQKKLAEIREKGEKR